jgi:hypothetical protein
LRIYLPHSSGILIAINTIVLPFENNVRLTGCTQMMERRPIATITQQDRREENCVEVNIVFAHELV